MRMRYAYIGCIRKGDRQMTTKQELSAAANLHMAAYRATGQEHHYQMALQYQTWAMEAGA